MKLDVRQNIPKLTMGIIFGLLVGVGIWFFLLRDNPGGSSSFSASRQISTVDRLRAVRDSLERYQKQHGRLPERLQDLDVNPEALAEGSGAPLNYQPGQPPKPIGRILVTAIAPPGKPGANKDKWTYAIIEDVHQKRLFLHATTKPGEISP